MRVQQRVCLASCDRCDRGCLAWIKAVDEAVVVCSAEGGRRIRSIDPCAAGVLAWKPCAKRRLILILQGKERLAGGLHGGIDDGLLLGEGIARLIEIALLV